MVIKACLFIISMLFPALIGILFLNKKENRISIWSAGRIYLVGQFAIWAAFQLLAVPMIRLKCSFSSLYYIFLALVLSFSALGGIRVFRYPIRCHSSLPKATIIRIILIILLGAIVYQCIMYIFGMHLDEDDARWLAEANDALSQDRMFLHNPSTGVYLGVFGGDMVRDSYSPWPMYIAFLSRFTGIRVATLSHTVYTPFLLILSYIAYACISSFVFKEKEERIIFLFAVAFIMLFFTGQGNTEAAFTLIRIWQGKAVVAAITIPAILSQILAIQERDSILNWLILFIMCCASCLFSGMGIVISAIMIGGYGAYLIICGRWRRIPFWVLAILPAAVFEILYQKFPR